MKKTILLNDNKTFSEREKKVFYLFWKAGFGVDVKIDALWHKYHSVASLSHGMSNPRQRQMSIGMCISRINRKLKGTKIVPGALKRTYRLTCV